MEHKQLLTVFNSLPVGIGFFTADGTLVRCNESFCRIFGADSQTLLGNKLNINENSVVPDVVKEAVRRCVPVQMSFLYDFDKQRTDKRFFSTRTRTCYLKCNGNPLYDNDGKFVNYIFDVAQHFLDEGYPVKYISPINEPQWKWGGSSVWQEGCHYETEELVEIFRMFAEEIILRDMPVKLYGPESGQYLGKTPEYLAALTGDEMIMKVLDVFAVHSYHSDNRPEERYEFKELCVDTHPSLRFDMSEWCELPNKSHTKDFKGALITARIIGQDIVYSGCVSWTSWVAVNNFSINEDGFDYSDAMITADFDFSDWYVAKRYYGFAHFSKFVPVGSVVLDFGFRPSEDNNDFNVFAFLTPDNKTVLVAVNEGESQSITVDGDFDKMQIITSVQDEELKEVYNGEFKNQIEIGSDSIVTVVIE